MQSLANELMEKTQAYWLISAAWNGKSKQKIQTGEAIQACSDIISRTTYVRPLSWRVDTLLQEIIKGESNPIKQEPAEVIFPANFVIA